MRGRIAIPGALLFMVTGCQPSNPDQQHLQYQQFERQVVRLERYVEADHYKAVSVEIGCVIATSDNGITLQALSPDLQGTEQIFVPAEKIREIIKIDEMTALTLVANRPPWPC